MAKRYSEAERKNYCVAWRASELNKNRFCKENKISESALHKWLRLYEPSLIGIDSKKSEINFLEIEPIIQTEKQKVEIQLPNGILLKLEIKSLPKLIEELTQ